MKTSARGQVENNLTVENTEHKSANSRISPLPTLLSSHWNWKSYRLINHLQCGSALPVRGRLRPPRLLGHSARPRLVDVLRGPAGQVLGPQAQLLAVHAADHVRRDAVVVAGELVAGHALEDPRLLARRRFKT